MKSPSRLLDPLSSSERPQVAPRNVQDDRRETMISIVTPSFRQLDWLRLALASVADQQGVEVEHIVQDGGSEAETLAPMAANPIVRLFSEPDDGMYDAINRGLRRTRGEICGYLNCDEQYLPGTLAKVTEIFCCPSRGGSLVWRSCCG